eukprot:1159306-Pelagomonas_calceolata.AAC.14
MMKPSNNCSPTGFLHAACTFLTWVARSTAQQWATGTPNWESATCAGGSNAACTLLAFCVCKSTVLTFIGRA